jgi:hypothetical protein
MFEALGFHVFPEIETDRRIEWKGKNSFRKGIISIGQHQVSREETVRDGSKPVPAGRMVIVFSMEVRLLDNAETNAETGRFEAVAFHVFPAAQTERIIEWRAQNSFGRGIISIGDDQVPPEETVRDGAKRVPAGQTVIVCSMDVRFI